MTRLHPLRFSAAALALAAVAAFSTGCDSGTTGTNTPPANNGGGHEHGHGEHAIGTVEVEGRSVTVNITGELEPGKTYAHCHLTVTGDPVDKMLIWIGDASGDGALKGNVTGMDNNHPIVDLEAPADLHDAVLGVEITVGGETYTATAPLVMDHDDDHDHDGDDHDHDHDDGDDHDHDGDGHPDH